MYSRIIDPETNTEYGLNSTHGITVLTNYIASLKVFTTKRQQLGGGRRSMVLPDDDEFNVPLNMYRAQTSGVHNGDESFVEESPEEEFSEEVVPEEESPEEEFSEEEVPEEELFSEKPNTESTLEVPMPSVDMDSVVQDDFENGEESSSEDSDEYY